MIKFLIIYITCLFSLNFVQASESFETKFSVGKQGKFEVVDVGFEFRRYHRLDKTGLFGLGVVDHKVLSSDRETVIDGYYKIGRDDTTFKLGIGYDFSLFDVAGYAGLGHSRATVSNSTLGEIKLNQLRQEFGIKIGYEFGDRDINPFLDTSQVRYSNQSKQTSILFGVSFGF